MRQDVKELWVNALRSGDYEQGEGILTSDSAVKLYCCLGVLCKVAVDNGVPVRVGEGGERISYDDSASYLPISVMEWAGLDTCDPFLKDNEGNEHCASSWNDIYRATFNDIATMIDANL
jgi:hypothetical protein